MIEVHAAIERWPTAQPFTIARGTKHFVDTVLVTVRAGETGGRGEGTPVYYLDQTSAGAVAMIDALGDARIDRATLQTLLPPGAARNALDCALWDLEAKDEGAPVWAIAGLHPPSPVTTALTLSLGDPGAMEIAARVAAARPLLKLKLGGDGVDRDRVAAVRRGAPAARLIVDANEAWGALDIEAEAAALALLGVELIEQPVPAGEEALLDGLRTRVPLGGGRKLPDARRSGSLRGALRGDQHQARQGGRADRGLGLARRGGGARLRGHGGLHALHQPRGRARAARGAGRALGGSGRPAAARARPRGRPALRWGRARLAGDGRALGLEHDPRQRCPAGVPLRRLLRRRGGGGRARHDARWPTVLGHPRATSVNRMQPSSTIEERAPRTGDRLALTLGISCAHLRRAQWQTTSNDPSSNSAPVAPGAARSRPVAHGKRHRRDRAHAGRASVRFTGKYRCANTWARSTNVTPSSPSGGGARRAERGARRHDRRG